MKAQPRQNVLIANETSGFAIVDDLNEVFKTKKPNYRELLRSRGVNLSQRQKKAISIRFRVRPLSTEYVPHPIQLNLTKIDAVYGIKILPIQIRITINGQEDGGFYLRIPAIEDGTIYADYVNGLLKGHNYGSVVTVNPALWNQKGQCLIGHSLEVSRFNDELKKAELAIKAVHSQQVDRYAAGIGPKPTTGSVKTEYLTGQVFETKRGYSIRYPKTIVGAAENFYQYLCSLDNTELAKSKSTLVSNRVALKHIISFLKMEQTPDLAITEINQGWTKRFYRWLIHEGPTVKAVTAREYTAFISHLVDFLVEHGQLQTDVLHGLKLPKAKKKPVYWLSSVNVESILQTIGKTDRERSALFWFRVMLYTGLDYSDSVRYVKNRSLYEVLGSAGRKIIIERSKNGSECHIPISHKLEAILAEPIPRAYCLYYINQDLIKIGTSIGFAHKLTTKIIRKTAGAEWLLEGYLIHEISRFLGHSSIAITESHYVKTSGIIVDKAMERKQKLDQASFRANLGS